MKKNYVEPTITLLNYRYDDIIATSSDDPTKSDGLGVDFGTDWSIKE